MIELFNRINVVPVTFEGQLKDLFSFSAKKEDIRISFFATNWMGSKGTGYFFRVVGRNPEGNQGNGILTEYVNKHSVYTPFLDGSFTYFKTVFGKGCNPFLGHFSFSDMTKFNLMNKIIEEYYSVNLDIPLDLLAMTITCHKDGFSIRFPEVSFYHEFTWDKAGMPSSFSWEEQYENGVTSSSYDRGFVLTNDTQFWTHLPNRDKIAPYVIETNNNKGKVSNLENFIFNQISQEYDLGSHALFVIETEKEWHYTIEPVNQVWNKERILLPSQRKREKDNPLFIKLPVGMNISYLSLIEGQVCSHCEEIYGDDFIEQSYSIYSIKPKKYLGAFPQAEDTEFKLPSKENTPPSLFNIFQGNVESFYFALALEENMVEDIIPLVILPRLRSKHSASIEPDLRYYKILEEADSISGMSYSIVEDYCDYLRERNVNTSNATLLDISEWNFLDIIDFALDQGQTTQLNLCIDINHLLNII